MDLKVLRARRELQELLDNLLALNFISRLRITVEVREHQIIF
jgi:hypothetical protein